MACSASWLTPKAKSGDFESAHSVHVEWLDRVSWRDQCAVGGREQVKGREISESSALPTERPKASLQYSTIRAATWYEVNEPPCKPQQAFRQELCARVALERFGLLLLQVCFRGLEGLESCGF